MITLATNACENDELRLGTTVPHWLRTLGPQIDEVVIVIDEEPRSGRLAQARGGGLEALLRTVDELRASDHRIRAVSINRRSPTLELNRKWFRHGDPVRCQAGTPIYAFLRAIEEARNDVVVKLDCDMLFVKGSWLEEAVRLLADWDIVEPARTGEKTAAGQVSTRVFAIDKRRFAARRLPLVPHRLDPLRRIHRRLHGRPTWLPLELMLSREVQRGRLAFCTLSTELGCSLHVATRDDFAIAGFQRVVAEVEAGCMPEAQVGAGPNFDRASWDSVLCAPPLGVRERRV